MTTGKSNRGFAAMDATRQREIASRGGRAAHERGNAHTFDSEQARQAGRRGGAAVSRDRQHMAEIGARGGRSPRSNRVPEHGGSAPVANVREPVEPTQAPETPATGDATRAADGGGA